jgi:hypothetical protein
VHIALKDVMNSLFLEDLAAKTHRGLTGRVERGLSAGGRLFGYRRVPLPLESASPRTTPTRFDVDEAEATVVRRIFRDYAGGQSMQAIAHALNVEAVPFPAQATKRGLVRRGWAVSTIAQALATLDEALTKSEHDEQR